MNSLDLRSFDNIHDFFTKFKSLLIHLKGCGMDKSTQHNQLILSILSKLGLEYVLFVSTFHIVKFTLGATWKMPTLDQFIESLTHEQDKLIKMGIIKGPNAHALVVHESSSTSNSKSKQKGKGKAHAEPKRKGAPNPSMIPQAPKVEKGRPNAVTTTVVIILSSHA